jgi:hypothetical protein
MYRLHFASPHPLGYSLTSAEIRALLNPADAHEAKHIAAIDRLEANGCQYSYQDFDILAAAYDEAMRR